jgi:putative transposase
MPNYRRTRIAGGTYFFTVVTFRRLPLLASSSAISVLQSSFEAVITRHPFTV